MITSREKDKIHQLISEAIKKYKTFFLSGHKKPDGDTVASELAMASLLKRMGKRVDIYNAETVPRSLHFLPQIHSIRTSKNVKQNYDVAIIFECCDANRMGNIIDLDRQAKVVINIDHHLKHSFFGDINLIDVTASSNSEQLFFLYKKMNLPINQFEATCLYAGIMADTGRFQYSNTNSQTLTIASELLKCGVEINTLCEKMFGTKTYSSLKLLGISLERMKSIENNKIVYSHLTKKDYRLTGSCDEETDEIVNYGLQVPTALMSILFRENQNERMIKVSFRSRKKVNVCKLAEEFGGGGHKLASGCEVNGPMDHALKKIISRARLLV